MIAFTHRRLFTDQKSRRGIHGNISQQTQAQSIRRVVHIPLLSYESCDYTITCMYYHLTKSPSLPLSRFHPLVPPRQMLTVPTIPRLVVRWGSFQSYTAKMKLPNTIFSPPPKKSRNETKTHPFSFAVIVITRNHLNPFQYKSKKFKFQKHYAPPQTTLDYNNSTAPHQAAEAALPPAPTQAQSTSTS